jgi:hypothetical protein
MPSDGLERMSSPCKYRRGINPATVFVAGLAIFLLLRLRCLLLILHLLHHLPARLVEIL